MIEPSGSCSVQSFTVGASRPGKVRLLSKNPVKRVRKGIRTPVLKRELTMLPRDVVPESRRSESER
jgi:hypothetical protein